MSESPMRSPPRVNRGKSALIQLAPWLAPLPGILLLLASALADIAGFGAPGFGAHQAAGVTAGLTAIAGWYVWNRWRRNHPTDPYFALLLCATVLLPLLLFGSLLLALPPLLRDADIPWQIAAPENEGLDASRLDLLRDQLAARNTSSLLLVRNGRIVYEWYSEEAGAEIPHYTASLQKSIAGGMALVVALSDGRLGLDEPAADYIPAWRDDPLHSQITIRQLAAHTSGIEDAREPGVQIDALTGWKRAFWKRDLNPFAIALDHARASSVPGTKLAYSSTGFAILSYAITASLRGTQARGIRELLRDRVMEPIGVPEDAWEMGHGAEYSLDGLRLHPIWRGGNYTARAVARIGQLMLNRGRWNGESLVRSEAVESVIHYAGTPIPDRSKNPHDPAKAAAWSVNFDSVWSTVPQDAFAGTGAGHQILLVVPSLELVVVRFGESLDDGAEPFWTSLERYLFKPVMGAFLRRPDLTTG